MNNIPGKIIFKAIVGSQAYGTNNEHSDIDIKGVYIQNVNDIIGYNKYQEQINVSKDECYYEIKRFLELLQKGNPTMIELLYTPEDCILEKTEEWNILCKYKEDFLTQECKNSFIGYAQSQISKAKGTDKKFNWEEKNMVRKEPLDFCYIIENIGTSSLKTWMENKNIKQENCIFNKLDHSQDIYQLYYYPNKLTKGLQSDNGNTIRVDSSEKDTFPIVNVIFNLNAYSIHCTKYNEYDKWLKNRNTQRYVDINEHGQKIDGKNMLHCVRLLRMGREILEGKGVIVRRNDAEELKSIRKGKYNLEEILEISKLEIEKIKNIKSNLPEKISDEKVHDLLIEIREYESFISIEDLRNKLTPIKNLIAMLEDSSYVYHENPEIHKLIENEINLTKSIIKYLAKQK